MKKILYLLFLLPVLSCTTQVINSTPNKIEASSKPVTSSNQSNPTNNIGYNPSQISKQVSEVYIVPDNITMNINSKNKIYGMVKYNDGSTDNNYKWSVNGTSVLIDNEGNLTPLKRGKSVITLTSNKDNSKKKSIDLNVNPVGKILIKEGNSIDFNAIAHNDKGEFIVVWQQLNGNDYGISFQRFNPYFKKINEITRIEDNKFMTHPSLSQEIRRPLKVLLNNNGDFVITSLSDDKIITAYILNNNIINKIEINHNFDEKYSLVLLENGNFSIRWTDTQNSDKLTYSQTYNKQGKLLPDNEQSDFKNENYYISDDNDDVINILEKRSINLSNKIFNNYSPSKDGGFFHSWVERKDNKFYLYVQEYDSSANSF